MLTQSACRSTAPFFLCSLVKMSCGNSWMAAKDQIHKHLTKLKQCFFYNLQFKTKYSASAMFISSLKMISRTECKVMWADTNALHSCTAENTGREEQVKPAFFPLSCEEKKQPQKNLDYSSAAIRSPATAQKEHEERGAAPIHTSKLGWMNLNYRGASGY